MPVLGILRPNLVDIDRRAPGTQTATGSAGSAVTRINSSVPALIDDGTAADAQWMVEGQVYTQSATLFLDALLPYEFPGLGAGDTIAVNGVTYTVATNERAAFPVLKAGDRVTDESGAVYLVLGTAYYYGPKPTIEAPLAFGRAWTG